MNLYGLLDAIINKVNRAVKVEKQELDSSLQKQARENINVPSKNEIYIPNLLDNSDFRNPVNQQGQSSYTTSGYTIDRWFTPSGATITVGDSGVTVAAYHFVQRIENKAFKQNGMVTFAMKLSDRLCIGTADISSIAVGAPAHVYNDGVAELQIYHESATIWQVFVIAATQITIEWAVLYEGEYTAETLPEYRPKGYAQELLICRQYDPYTGEYIGLRKFGQPKNLLDNSDFRNPVNQRGGTEYINAYNIDRWQTASNTNGYVYVKDGYIEVTAPNSTSIHEYTDFYQNFKFRDMMIGKTYTMVANISGTIYCTPFTFGECDAGIRLTDNVVFYSVPNLEYLLRIYNTTQLYWAALYEGEYTADTLPEYHPKGYANEFSICCQYSITSDGNYIGPKNIVLEHVYPVGSIYMSVNNVSPASFLGGTWAALKDRFLIGAGNTYAVNATGGSTTHTLTVNEMPSHNHQTNITVYSSSASTTGWVRDTVEKTYQTQSFTSTSTGGGAAHNNMPPYLAVYMWKRTA